MTRITIDVSSEEDKKVIMDLLDQLHISAEVTELPVPNGQKMAEIMEEISRGNPYSGIKDPVAWQREIRKDRKLPGRD